MTAATTYQRWCSPPVGEAVTTRHGRCGTGCVAGTLPGMTTTMIRLVSCVAAVLAAAVTFALLHGIAGIDLAARTGTTVRHITVAAVVLAASASAAAGWGVLALLERFATRARSLWTAIAAAALLLSLLVGPTAGITPAAKAGLAALHLVVGAIIIGGLRRSTR